MAAWDLHMAVFFIRRLEEHIKDCSLRAAGAACIADPGVASKTIHHGPTAACGQAAWHAPGKVPQEQLPGELGVTQTIEKVSCLLA